MSEPEEMARLAALEARIAHLEAQCREHRDELRGQRDQMARIEALLRAHLIKCPGEVEGG